MRTLLTAMLALCIALLAQPASAQQSNAWYSLQVPGGRPTLHALGVDDARERSLIMIELIRRLHFSTQTPNPLQAALQKIPTAGAETITLPLAMAPGTWEKVIFGRPVPPSRMFAEILNDPAARLLYHGLAGLDADTRAWIEGQPDLLRALYRNTEACKSFALFA